jgi:hypothetical protein
MFPCHVLTPGMLACSLFPTTMRKPYFAVTCNVEVLPAAGHGVRSSCCLP